MATTTHSALENLSREDLRSECFEIGCLLTNPDEFHRNIQRFVYGEHDPALGRSVDLGHDETRYWNRLGECLSLGNCILSDRSVEHE